MSSREPLSTRPACSLALGPTFSDCLPEAGTGHLWRASVPSWHNSEMQVMLLLTGPHTVLGTQACLPPTRRSVLLCSTRLLQRDRRPVPDVGLERGPV